MPESVARSSKFGWVLTWPDADVRIGICAGGPRKLGSRSVGSILREPPGSAGVPESRVAVDYRNLGLSGLKVSVIALGGWITMGDRVDTTTVRKIVRLAVDRGVNLFDLADSYAAGEAERVFGSLLGEFKRSDLVLSSKVALPVGDGPNDRGLGRKHIMESLEQSLRNLGTDYLDLYFCHREDPNTPLEETLFAMDDLIRQGKVLYWGTSMWKPATLRRGWNLDFLLGSGLRGFRAPGAGHGLI